MIKISYTPGNEGKDCLGNGLHTDEFGDIIECCCDECNYLICCTNFGGFPECDICEDEKCPRVNQK